MKISDALKYVNDIIVDLEDDLQHYTMVEKDKCREFFISEDLKQFSIIKQALLKAQKQEEILTILKESPFILQNIFDNKGLKNQNVQNVYDYNYFWSTISEENVKKVEEWLEDDTK